MNAVRALLDHAIDYAGLFPPAALPLPEAVGHYARYLDSPDRWALGRFVVPVNQLDQFRGIAAPLMRPDLPWRLSAIGGKDPLPDQDAVQAFNRDGGAGVIDCFEFRVGPVEQLADMVQRNAPGLRRYAEVAWDQPVEPYLSLLRRTGTGLKLRTGGVEARAFPPPDAVLNRLEAALDAGVAFKCTAGLHHPVRGRYRLTYDAGAPEAMMYGYLNVMVAAAALRSGAGAETARAILLEEDPAAFRFETDEVGWRELGIPAAMLSAMRAEGSLAFGSCSFREPMEELIRVPVE